MMNSYHLKIGTSINGSVFSLCILLETLPWVNIIIYCRGVIVGYCQLSRGDSHGGCVVEIFL